tara:strand:- start:1103 stop:1933 length:831 start_codon:yes stop_codon:yes gene_type:complete
MTLARSMPQLTQDGEIEIVHSLDNYVLKDDGLVIEVFGIPKSGKSWQIKRVLRRLSRDPKFRAMVPDFEFVVYKDDIKERFSKDPRYEFHRCKVLDHETNLRRVRQPRKPGDDLTPVNLVVSDRGPIDDNHWAYELHEEREISLTEREDLLDISREAEKLVHAGVLVYVDPEEAFKREHETVQETGHPSRRGRVMNPNTLGGLASVYDFTRRREKYSTIDRKENPIETRITTRDILSIDTTDYNSKKSNADEVYRFFFDLFVPTSEESKNGNPKDN